MKTKMTFKQPVIYPDWLPRHTHKERYKRVSPSIMRSLRLIERNATKLGIEEVIITTNHELSMEGDGGHNNKGPAAAVYFYYKGNKTVIAQDIYFTVRQNLYAIGKVLGAYVEIKKQKCKAITYTEFENISSLNPVSL